MPYMNQRVESGEAAFIVHTGDLVGGGGLAENARCNEYVSRSFHFLFLFIMMYKNSHSLLPLQMFQSRYDVFSTGTNFMLLPGDVSFSFVYEPMMCAFILSLMNRSMYLM